MDFKRYMFDVECGRFRNRFPRRRHDRYLPPCRRRAGYLSGQSFRHVLEAYHASAARLCSCRIRCYCLSGRFYRTRLRSERVWRSSAIHVGMERDRRFLDERRSESAFISNSYNELSSSCHRRCAGSNRGLGHDNDNRRFYSDRRAGHGFPGFGSDASAVALVD